MKELWRWGIALAIGFVVGASGRTPLAGNMKDEVIFFVERYAKCPVGGPLSL
jgi:hypothetical protein